MPNIAILIDAENVQPTYAEKIMTQAAALGSIVSKEIYGTAQALNNWVEPVLKYAFHPNLTIKASKGKNSSDIALVIGAMDLIAATPVETILLASSDSDFSALSVRLRSAGIHVVGMGTERSNPLWRTACSEFIVFNSVTAPRPAQSKEKPQQAPSKAKQAAAQGSQEAKPASAKQAAAPSTHTSRVAVIRSVIVNTLEAHQGGCPPLSSLRFSTPCRNTGRISSAPGGSR